MSSAENRVRKAMYPLPSPSLPSQVIVMQAYKNNSPVAIEAKYVFPLDDMAAVCGFEAFINGKHIMGQVHMYMYMYM